MQIWDAPLSPRGPTPALQFPIPVRAWGRGGGGGRPQGPCWGFVGGDGAPSQRFLAAAVSVVWRQKGPELGGRREFQVGVPPSDFLAKGAVSTRRETREGGGGVSLRNDQEVPGLSRIKCGMASRLLRNPGWVQQDVGRDPEALGAVRLSTSGLVPRRPPFHCL